MIFRKFKLKVIVFLLLSVFAINSGVQPQQLNNTQAKRYNDINFTSFIAPVVLIGYGLTTFGNNGFPLSSNEIYDYRQKHFGNFNTNLDDIIAFFPALTAYTLQIDCYKAKNSLKDMTIIFALSNIVGIGSAQALKVITENERPDKSNNRAFPSSHTVFAFIGADMLHQEYGGKNIWFSIGGYTTASAVGILRILNNKHWFSDVIVGAGIGILSSRISYLFYNKVIKNYPEESTKLKLNLVPDIYNKGMKFSFSYLVF